MVDRALLVSLLEWISLAKVGNGSGGSAEPFGGISVILCGDLHQFPPVARKSRAPLYVGVDPIIGKGPECIGRRIWEGFNIVVQLQSQVCTKDPIWHDFLHHLRLGQVQAHHIAMLERLVLTHPDCPPTDFTKYPWSEAVLVTPRHSVRVRWNEAALTKHCEEKGVQLFKAPTEDTTNRRELTNNEKLRVIRQTTRGRDSVRQLPDEVNLAVGMKGMVTFNVNTEKDITNGARGEVVGIIVDEAEPSIPRERIVQLKYPPAIVLFKLARTRLRPLPGLPPSVIPIVPKTSSFRVDGDEEAATHDRSICVHRLQSTGTNHCKRCCQHCEAHQWQSKLAPCLRSFVT